MPVPRPLLLAVLGLLLLSATFFATRNANKASEPSEPAAQSAAAKPSPKPKADSQPAEKSEAAAPKPEPAKKQASASATDEPQARPAERKRAASNPKAVERAVADGRVVVLAFFQLGADDAETRAAVAHVKRRRLAAVFTDSINRIGRYGSVVGTLGIHQAPAVVIIDANKKARLVEGYVDPESLAQEVSDARR